MRIESGLSKTAFSADAPLVTEALSLYQTYLYDIERGKERKSVRGWEGGRVGDSVGGWEGGRNEGRREGWMTPKQQVNKGTKRPNM